ncbi:hypothetical protein [Kordiimonas sp. SCSIO 12610]|uniref:hypothetical protein n=1 Tax=Kordiimonas sp. SCSIO 12610 TaxID=2829597 RepID=UPI00210B4E71|nr:hypothetical protein [Kordiimonas sp. SCSIO 12610]UTW56598.1 hypothetical protein KFF44_06790 [Kordiimonas sp. SCSIO 12610]
MTEGWELLLLSFVAFCLVFWGHYSGRSDLTWSVGVFDRKKYPIRFWISQGFWIAIGLITLFLGL